MATSGSTSFNVTRDDIILMALEDIGAYSPDFALPTPGEMSRANRRLNAMIKAWQATGVGLWLNRLYTQALTAGAMSYLLGPGGNPAIPRPLGVVEARLRRSDGTETPLTPISRDEYMTLPQKASTGPAVQYYYDSQTVNGVLYVWPVDTDLTDVIVMTLRTPVQDFISLDDTPDFPVEWTDALHYGLAIRLCGPFKLMQNLQYVTAMAGNALQEADGFDREQNVSLQLAPDMGY